MNLIPYQVKLLKQEYANNSEERKNLINGEKARREGQVIIDGEHGTSIDSAYQNEMTRNSYRNREILSILDTSNVITEYNDNQVSVGTTFNICYLDDEFEEETFTLIEQKVSTESSNEGFISLNSLMGNAVHRKRIGETFAYTTESGVLVGGMVSKIFTKEEQLEHLKTTPENQKQYRK